MFNFNIFMLVRPLNMLHYMLKAKKGLNSKKGVKWDMLKNAC